MPLSPCEVYAADTTDKPFKSTALYYSTLLLLKEQHTKKNIPANLPAGFTLSLREISLPRTNTAMGFSNDLVDNVKEWLMLAIEDYL
jgi:hypothetical protein